MEGPTQHLPPPPSPPPPGFGPGAAWQGARLPVPGNAEWLLWLAVEIVFAIVWAASPAVNGLVFVLATAVVTLGYLVSRGIAKAGKVLEQ
jgi:hypothetical protein